MGVWGLGVEGSGFRVYGVGKSPGEGLELSNSTLYLLAQKRLEVQKSGILCNLFCWAAAGPKDVFPFRSIQERTAGGLR